jgi:hypothetical protein
MHNGGMGVKLKLKNIFTQGFCNREFGLRDDYIIGLHPLK